MLGAGRAMMLKGFAVLLAISLVILLAAVACGGEDGGGGQTPQAGETPAADEAPSADGGDGDDEGDGGDGGEGLSDLEALAAEAEGVIAKITYRYMSDVGGEVTEGEWVLVQRPPDSRFEMSFTEGGEDFRTIIITSGGKSYLCFAGGGEESCLETEAEEAEAETALFDPLFDVPSEIAEDAADVDLVDKSERSIAGLDATCFTVSSGLADLGEGEMCFSEGGILLLLRSETDGDSWTFEATSVSTDVSDEDFEPPYDILDLPGFDELPDFEIPTP